MSVVEAVAPVETALPRWSLPLRIAFRFAFVYWLATWLPFPLGQIPGIGKLVEPYDRLWKWLVPWVARALLGARQPVPTEMTGSGDTLFAWVQLLCHLALAVAATAVWSLVDRRAHHRRLHFWLRIYLRYALASTMLTYGTIKVLKSQFPFPSAARLMQPIGDSSPMGLLWTFMGVSAGYTIFAGAGEVLSGLLLLFRRTTTLGALVTVGVMTNVVMLNFCYDVPVKLFSTQLVLMALVLLAPDARRLASVLLLNRPTGAADLAWPPSGPWLRRARIGLKTGVVCAAIGMTTSRAYEGWRKWGDGHTPDPLDGAYEVEAFVRDGNAADPRRWRRVGLSMWGRLTVRRLDDGADRYRLERDDKQHTFTLRPDGSDVKSVLTYATDGERLTLDGTLDGAPTHVELRKLSSSSFLLLGRGFRFIQEVPYNR
jgi:uncharacterized membrane protein YphA (DoxX/SURF4 family)